MKANQLARLARLEELYAQWRTDNRTVESFWMEDNTVTPQTWTQRGGLVRHAPIEFDTPAAALQWVTDNLGEDRQAQIYVNDIRDILPEEERAVFDALFPDAPDYQVMFDLRPGLDVTAEAMRLWRHCLSGVRYDEWRRAAEERVEGLLLELDA